MEAPGVLALVSLEIPVEISNLAYLTSDVAHRLENLVVEMQNKNNFSDALTATRPDLTTNNIVVRGKQIFSRVIYVGLKVVRCAPLVFGRVRELE